jgi:TonB-linked SusC/RagA family outer membrane protein
MPNNSYLFAKIIYGFFLSLFFFMMSSSAQAQGTFEEIIYRGKIVDSLNNPIQGVSVVIKGTKYGTITNDEGQFSLKIPQERPVVFVISAVGYKTMEQSAGSNLNFVFKLQSTSEILDDVVVVGYGTKKRNEVSGAVTKISSQMLTKQPITSFDQGLAGMTPGVVLREGTGAPGSAPEILIRGINGFGGNTPLVVIDNVIFEEANSNQTNNPLALINPEDIESITILKDAITKSIYGSRANNGVIIVTTKKGKEGKAKIEFSTSFGVQNILPFERPNMMNATELARFFKEKEIDRVRVINPAYADPRIPVPDSLLPANRRYDPTSFGEGTNWFDAITQQAFTQNYNLNVSGGTENIKYFISGNFLNQEGVLKRNNLLRYSLRANIDVKISKKLKFGLNFSPSRTEQNRPSDDPGGGQFSIYTTTGSTYWADPSAPLRNPNGKLTPLTRGNLTINWTSNPLFQIENEVEKRRSTLFLLSTHLEYQPIKNLFLRSEFSYGYTVARTRNFRPSTLVNDNNLTPPFPNLSGGRATLFNSLSENLTLDNTLRYVLNKNKHSAEAMVGYSVQDQSVETSTLSAQRILDENFQLPSFSNVDPAVAGAFTGSEGFGQNRLLSYISRVNYSYDRRYLLNFTIRRDGSSRFGRNVQYGNFPAVSAGWRLSEEKFLRRWKDSWLDELKIEGGYGLTGNLRGPGNYGHLGSVGQANYIFGGTSGFGNTLNGLPNPEITWEETKQWDIGLTASLFRRINLTFNVYQQLTKGALATIPLSWVTGFGGVQDNTNAVTRNRGFELDITGVVIKKRNFTYTANVNLSRYANILVDYFNPNGIFIANNGSGFGVASFIKGQPIGMYRGVRYTGLFTAAEIADPNVPKYPGAIVGSMKWEDVNKDGILNIGTQLDFDYLANPHPDLMFGTSHSITFKKFTLRAVFAGQFGGAIYDLRREFMWNVDGNFNVSRLMLDRFRPGDDPATKFFPTTVSLTGSTTRAIRFSGSHMIYDGTYVALKNLLFSYNMVDLINKKKRLLSSCEVYLSGRNLFYIAAYKYGNPEARRAGEGSGARSINYGSYPVARTFTFGVNISL